jgi:hypothetical protein
MFQNPELQAKIKDSSSLNTQAQIIAEWNLNTFNNIKKIGNYRYRPTVSSPTQANWGVPAGVFDETDALNAYTNATDSDIVVDGGSNENNIPQVFLSQDVKKSLLYSLEDCFYRFRPRSGINKILFLNNKKFNIFSKDMFRRPRYYASSPEDKFKYWTSYRKESGQSQDKFFINNIKFVETGSQVSATFTTSVSHNLKVSDEVFVKAGLANSSLNFLPKTYKITSIPSGTKFTVSESATVFDELTGDIVGSGGQSITVTGSEVSDVLVYITRLSTERGISFSQAVGGVTKNYISDAAPFAVYQNEMPTNRIVLKMQTNVGTVDLGPFRNEASEYSDPFFGDANKTVPDSWKVQYLNSSNEWVDLQGNEEALELDETAVGADGYVELSYGLIIPEEYKEIFIYAGNFLAENSLPSAAPNGYAYLVQSGESLGEFNIWVDGEWEQFSPVYGWQKEGAEPNRLTNYVTELVNPDYFVDGGETIYRELQYIKGLRVVVESMNTNQSTFDLIEMSPRLTVDITERSESIDITKGSSDIGNSGLLVSGLVVSSGQLEIFDYDNAFGKYNNESILAIKNSAGNIQYSVASNNLQVKVFDIIFDDDGIGYHVPIKTMYSDGFPDVSSQSRSVSINLRDGFFYLESMTAPELLFSKASLSFVIASLMDSIGFSNYQFKRIEDKDEPIIPYFFVKPNTNVAEVLEALALSTQTAIFFDEYNNLTLMSKEYLMPDPADRSIDYTFYGSYDSEKSSDGIIKNERNSNELANFVEVSSRDEEVYNDGKIIYSTRSIIKDMSQLNQAYLKDSEKSWKYRSVLLWEVAPEERSKPINGTFGAR